MGGTQVASAVEAEVALRVRELEKAEAATQRIEAQIRRSCPHVDRVLIHAEPVRRTHWQYAIPLVDMDGTVSAHLGEAPHFAVVRVRTTDGTIEEQRIAANPYLDQEKARGLRVAEWLVGQKVDVVLVKEDLSGKGPVYAFSSAGVELRKTAADTLAQAIREQFASLV